MQYNDICTGDASKTAYCLQLAQQMEQLDSVVEVFSDMPTSYYVRGAAQLHNQQSIAKSRRTRSYFELARYQTSNNFNMNDATGSEFLFWRHASSSVFGRLGMFGAGKRLSLP